MNRQTRKANLKKLQLRATTNENKRNTRSSHSAAISISNYLNPPTTAAVTTNTHTNNFAIMQEPLGLQVDNKILSSPPTTSVKAAEKTKLSKAKRTKLTDFVLRDDDFEPSSQIKKAPAIKKTKKQTTAGTTSRNTRSKKQPNIKSAFFRNEQMFAEIAAQHCIADNFSPDDVEMALAMSKSEMAVEIDANAAVDRDVVVELLDGKGKPVENINETIRTKLKKYGFRTGNLEDYATYTANLLPGGHHRRAKCKWANKFTSLTLRNAEVQQKKAQRKIEEFLALQFKITHPNDVDYYVKPYEPLTSVLKLCTASRSDMIVHQSDKYNVPTHENLRLYFVQNLFEVAAVNGGHLLKDWDSIQGRDLSPQRKSKQIHLMEEKLNMIYSDLDIHFNRQNNAVHSSDQKVKSAISESEIELDKMVELIENMTNTCSDDTATPQRLKVHEMNSSNENLLSTTQINIGMDEIEPSSQVKICRPVISVSEIELDKMVELIENMTNTCSNDTATPQGLKVHEMNSINENLLTTTQINSDMDVIEPWSQVGICGPTSPDIFADSDAEMDTDMILTEMEAKDDIANDVESIATYEIYSSDEAKTVLHSGNTVANVETSEPPIIDLTQCDGKENDKEEVTINMHVPKTTDTLYHNLLEGTINMSFLEEVREQKRDSRESISTVIAENDAVLKELTEKYLKTETLKTKKSKRSMESLTQVNVPRLLKRSFTMTQTSNNSDLMSTDDIAFAPKSDVSTLQRRSRSAIFPAPSTNISPDANFKLSCLSIDLTQEDDADDDVENSIDDCMLSDDEINYSIWKANDSKHASLCDKNQHEFSILDLIEDEGSPLKPTSSSSHNAMSLECETKEEHLVSNSIEFDLENNHYAIYKTPTKAPTHSDNDDELSFTHSKESNAPMRRFRSTGSARKFNDLLLNFQQGDVTPPRFEDFDEFDRLIYGSAERKQKTKQHSVTPQGMHALLTADINFVPVQVSPMKLANTPPPIQLITPTKPPTAKDAGGEVVFDGRVYSVRRCTSPVTDYATYNDNKLLKTLYDYGIKPLKRTQAVKLLQYIYDVTHPLIEAENDIPQASATTTANAASEFDDLYQKYGISQPKNIDPINVKSTTKSCAPKAPKEITIPEATKLNLCDCSGELLLRYSDVLKSDVLPNELYTLPTNVTKKTSRPLLPFHIAWHNLVCSNQTLHENLLTFLPIDLQEIYLFLKNLGYRYDPKEMKTFFDNRCIIFRYDLTPAGKTANTNRHVHKNKRKGTLKS